MLYKLSNELQREQFIKRVKTLLDKGASVELVERVKRSHNQNSYLHLILGVVAMDCGNTINYVKEWYYKRLVNPDIYIVEKVDKFQGKIHILRSSADLSQEEMSISIERFKKWASEQGIYIPEMGDEEILKEIEFEMGRMRGYLYG